MGVWVGHLLVPISTLAAAANVVVWNPTKRKTNRVVRSPLSSLPHTVFSHEDVVHVHSRYIHRPVIDVGRTP